MAHAAALAAAEDQGGVYNHYLSTVALVLVRHLMQAIGHQMVKLDHCQQYVIVTFTNDFIYSIKISLKTTSDANIETSIYY